MRVGIGGSACSNCPDSGPGRVTGFRERGKPRARRARRLGYEQRATLEIFTPGRGRPEREGGASPVHAAAQERRWLLALLTARRPWWRRWFR
jgi:hypothetical protein